MSQMSLKQKYPRKDDLTTEEAVTQIKQLVGECEQWIFIGVRGAEQSWTYSHDSLMDARFMVDNALKGFGGAR